MDENPADPTYALQRIQNFADWLKIQSKETKIWLTPQYKPVANAIVETIDNILNVNTTLMDKVNTLQELKLNSKDQKLFNEFYYSYFRFRMGGKFHSALYHCSFFYAIYEQSLKTPLKKFFNRDEQKIEIAEKIFKDFVNAEESFTKLLEDPKTGLYGQFEKTLRRIKRSYKNGQEIRSKFLEKYDTKLIKIQKQSDELKNVRTKFIKETGTSV